MSAHPGSCIGQNPTCPCQDGDACHYEDTPTTKGWPVPDDQTGALRKQPEAVDHNRVISGPAFPSSNSPETGYYAEGMTLLDYFAARAPLEIMLSQTVAQEGWGSARHIAVASFDYAEAMVAESLARQTASGSHQEARSDEQGEST